MDRFFLGVATLLLAGALAGDATALQYDRTALLAGEWWRLWTGHLVHTGWPHTLMNLAGLGALRWVFGPALTARAWLAATVFIMPAISVALLWSLPELHWYRGFSGVLHGLAALALTSSLSRHARLPWVLLAALGVKVIGEYGFGASASLERWIAAPVITQAHFYGVCLGCFCALPLRAHGFFMATRQPHRVDALAADRTSL